MENTKLTADNLYANGVILDNGDETYSLEREPVEYVDSYKDKPYTICQGDTLSNLAYNAYRNSKLWHVIADKNLQILDPFHLEVGLDIVIPYLEDKSKGYDN